MTRKLYLFLLLLAAVPALLRAQAPGAVTYAIKGVVVDSSNHKPVEFVTVSLRTAQKQPVKTQLTKPDGAFALEKIPAGSYILSVVSVGFGTKTMPVTLSGDTKTRDLGWLVIAASTTQLKAVALTGEKPLIKQEADRLAYDLQADPESKTNSVLEMMRKVPMLTVDADDNVQLKGNSNYKILVNGKPSSMMERNAKDVLRSMPASTIQRIEVITTPPAKYDAEGLAGIINIITNKTVDNGYNGSVNVSERYPTGGPGTGGSLTYKQGRFGLSAYGGASLSENPSTYLTSNRVSRESSPSTLFQSTDRTSDGRSAYLGSELSYEIDSLNLLSGSFNLNGSDGTAGFIQQSQLSNSGGIMEGYELRNNSDNTGSGIDAAVNYQKGFKGKKNRLFTVSYRYYGFRNEGNSVLNALNRVNYSVPDYRQENVSRAGEQTVQADYVHPLKKVLIEAGVKGIFRNNESDFHYLSQASSGVFVIDPTRTNTFNNRQNVYGMYNSYTISLKTWSIKAGVRVENTVIDADFVSTSSSVKQNYFNVVPSIALNHNFKNRSSINFGFQQRMQRPGINQLNPFVDRSNPNFETTGNPALRPTTGTQMQIGYSKFKKASINMNLNFNLIDGLIFQVSNYDPATNITRTRFENIGGAKALGGNINVNYPFSPAWNMSLNGNLMHGWAEGMSNGKPIKNHGFMYNVNVSSGVKFNKGWRANGNAYLSGGQLTIQDKSNAFVSTSLSVNKDIVKDKLSFSAFSNNPFSRYRVNITNTFGPNFDQVNNSQQNFRTLGASLNYRFGKLKESIKKNQRGIKNDDVSN